VITLDSFNLTYNITQVLHIFVFKSTLLKKKIFVVNIEMKMKSKVRGNRVISVAVFYYL